MGEYGVSVLGELNKYEFNRLSWSGRGLLGNVWKPLMKYVTHKIVKLQILSGLTAPTTGKNTMMFSTLEPPNSFRTMKLSNK